MKWFCKHYWVKEDMGDPDVPEDTDYHQREIYFLRCIYCQKVIAKAKWNIFHRKPKEITLVGEYKGINPDGKLN